jgi:ATP-dependent Lon protease
MAAYRAGVSTVFIPKANESDLAELDKKVLEKVTFITVSDVKTVIEQALCPIENTEKKADIIPNLTVSDLSSGRISQ